MTHLNNGRVLLATLLELLVVQLGILVQVHPPEQLVNSLRDIQTRLSSISLLPRSISAIGEFA